MRGAPDMDGHARRRTRPLLLAFPAGVLVLGASGGLILSTGTSDAGVDDNGGTLAITDPGGVGVGVDNTLATTTGIALNLDSAATCSGGAIQNSTGDGISLRGWPTRTSPGTGRSRTRS